jgi:hypothetical protein
MKPKLKPPGTKLLKLRYVEPLSDIAFKFNLRRYNMARMLAVNAGLRVLKLGRGLHSSTFQLNVSRF